MKTASGLKGAVRRHSVVAKVLLIGILSLVLLVPLLMLQSVVGEREQRKAETESEIMQAWGGPQTLAGPFLTVPYISRSRDANGKPVETVQAVHFLPQILAIDGSLLPETRARGMYQVTVYAARVSFQGTFGRPDFSGYRVSPADILWDQAFVSLELPAGGGAGEAGVPFRHGKHRDVRRGNARGGPRPGPCGGLAGPRCRCPVFLRARTPRWRFDQLPAARG